MNFDKVINSLLKEELSREDRIKALKVIEDVSPVMLVFTYVRRHIKEDRFSISVNEPWRIVTTYPGTPIYDSYFKGMNGYYGYEVNVIKEEDIHIHLNKLDLVFAFWPKKEGEYWYRKMEQIRGEEYLHDDNESVVVEPEGDPIQGWTERDEKDWAEWVKDWVTGLDF